MLLPPYQVTIHSIPIKLQERSRVPYPAQDGANPEPAAATCAVQVQGPLGREPVLRPRPPTGRSAVGMWASIFIGLLCSSCLETYQSYSLGSSFLVNSYLLLSTRQTTREAGWTNPSLLLFNLLLCTCRRPRPSWQVLQPPAKRPPPLHFACPALRLPEDTHSRVQLHFLFLCSIWGSLKLWLLSAACESLHRACRLDWRPSLRIDAAPLRHHLSAWKTTRDEGTRKCTLSPSQPEP